MKKCCILFFLFFCMLFSGCTSEPDSSSEQPQEQVYPLTFQAVQVSADGAVLGECSFQWNPSITEDGKYSGFEISVDGHYDINTEHYEGDEIPVLSSESRPFDYITLPCYLSRFNTFCPVEVLLDNDRQWCVLIVNDTTHGTDYFIGIADPTIDPLHIYEEWHTFFD